MIKRISLVFFLIALGASLCIAKNAPDIAYYRASKKINRDLIAQRPDSCLRIYLELNKSYRLLTTDMDGFWRLALRSEDSIAFFQAGELMMKNSGKRLEQIIAEYAPAFNYLNHPNLRNAYLNLKTDEVSFINFAKANLNWYDISFILQLEVSNIDFRYIPTEYFKDTSNHLRAMAFVDSMHLSRLADHVRQHGFPRMSEVGITSGAIQPVLKHAVGLLSQTDSIGYQNSLVCWKILMPAMYQCAKDGEMDLYFYKFIYRNINAALNGNKRSRDVESFKDYNL